MTAAVICVALLAPACRSSEEVPAYVPAPPAPKPRPVPVAQPEKKKTAPSANDAVLFALDVCGVTSSTVTNEHFIIAHSPAICPPGRCSIGSIQRLSGDTLPDPVRDGDTEDTLGTRWRERLAQDGGKGCHTQVRSLVSRWLAEDSPLAAGTLVVWFDGMVDDGTDNVVVGPDDVSRIAGAWFFAGTFSGVPSNDRPTVAYVFARTDGDVSNARRTARAFAELKKPTWVSRVPLEIFPGEPTATVTMSYESPSPSPEAGQGPVPLPPVFRDGSRIIEHVSERSSSTEAIIDIPSEPVGMRFPTFQYLRADDHWKLRAVKVALERTGPVAAALSVPDLRFGVRVDFPQNPVTREWHLNPTTYRKTALSEPLRFERIATEQKGGAEHLDATIYYGSFLPCAPLPSTDLSKGAAVGACPTEVERTHLVDATRSVTDVAGARVGKGDPFLVAAGIRKQRPGDPPSPDAGVPAPLATPLDTAIVVRWDPDQEHSRECLESRVSFAPGVDVRDAIATAQSHCDSAYYRYLIELFAPKGMGQAFASATVAVGDSGAQSKIKGFGGLDHLVRSFGERAARTYGAENGQRVLGIRLQPPRATATGVTPLHATGDDR